MIARRRGGIGGWLADNYEHLALGEYPIDHEETPVTGTTLTDAFPGVDVLNQLTGRAAGLPVWSASVTVGTSQVTGATFQTLTVLVHEAEHVALWAAALDGAEVTVDERDEATYTRTECEYGHVWMSVAHVLHHQATAVAA